MDNSVVNNVNDIDNISDNINVSIKDKAFLTIKEAVEYFGIGQSKIRELTDQRNCDFVLFNGSKRLIKRTKMEKYLESQYSI